ncbi:MAG: NAD(+)/NADH kinase [Nitrospiria bacterium]
MQKIGIVLKANHPAGKETLDALVGWLDHQGKEVLQIASSQQQLPIPALDLLIVLGGDGTFLSAARQVEGRDIPLLGVNLGSLGFLTEITLEEIYATLERIFQKGYLEDFRQTLSCYVKRGSVRLDQPTVLNDVTIHKGALSKLIHLEITIDGQFVTAIRADGLIVSSPTGSTGYSLSSGGPIVHPSVDAMLLTPISPHMLTNRPIVVPSGAEVSVVLKTDHQGPVAMFDGQEVCPLVKNDAVHITAAKEKLKVIRSPNRSYYQVLRQKLKWGES